MRNLLKTLALGAALSLPFVAAIGAKVTLPVGGDLGTAQYVLVGDATAMSAQHRQQREQRMAQQEGTLKSCFTPDEVVADAKKGAKDEYRGSRILTDDEVAKLVRYVFETHGVLFATKTMVVVYLKNVAVVFTGDADDGKVCDFEVIDAKAMRNMLDRVLGVTSQYRAPVYGGFGAGSV
jgi:hypothetical protein